MHARLVLVIALVVGVVAPVSAGFTEPALAATSATGFFHFEDPTHMGWATTSEDVKTTVTPSRIQPGEGFSFEIDETVVDVANDASGTCEQDSRSHQPREYATFKYPLTLDTESDPYPWTAEGGVALDVNGYAEVWQHWYCEGPRGAHSQRDLTGGTVSGSETVDLDPGCYKILGINDGVYWDPVGDSSWTGDYAVLTVGDADCGRTGSADLAVTMTAESPVRQDALLHYLVTVTNTGPDAAQLVTVEDTLPFAAQLFLEATTTNGSCSLVQRIVRCIADGLPQGQRIDIRITVRTPAEPTQIDNEVRVSASTPDPNPANNTAALTTVVNDAVWGRDVENPRCGKLPNGLNTCDYWLEVGDILVWQNDHSVADLIGMGYWTHAAIVVEKSALDENADGYKDVHIVQTLMDQGAHKGLIHSSEWAEVETFAVIRPAVDARSRIEAALHAEAYAAETVPYKLQPRCGIESADCFYCSSLVWRAYKDAGVSLANPYNALLASGLAGKIGFVLPDHLAQPSASGVERSYIQRSAGSGTVSAHGPVRILVTDPSGRQTGFQADGTKLVGIPESRSWRDDLRGDVVAASGLRPDWNVTVLGTGAGEYTVTLDLVGNEAGQVATVTGSATAGSRRSFRLGDHANKAPVARLSVTAPTGLGSGTLRLDASKSLDEDGSLTGYGWDVDGDGRVDQRTSTPRLEHSYGDLSGRTRIAPRVYVTDDDGGVGSATGAVLAVEDGASLLPSLEVTATQGSGHAPLATSFAVTGVGVEDLLPLRWEFEDGTTLTSSDTTVAHTFTVPWTYRVQVTSLSRPEATATVGVDVIESVRRVSDEDRVGTSLAVARTAWPPDSADAVVLAGAHDFPDALAATPLAAAVGGPVLLNGRDALDPRVASTVARLGASTVYLLGGSAAQSGEVETALKRVPGVTSVVRIAGRDRFETGSLAAQRAAAHWKSVGRDDAGQRVLVALGNHPGGPSRAWPDALAAGQLAGHGYQPILLTTPDSAPAATREALDRLGAKHVTIVGGTGAISDATARALAGSRSWSRIGGADRYETAALLAAEAARHGASVDRIWLATGRSFPDGLAAGAAAVRQGGMLLLTDPADLDRSAATASWITKHRAAVQQVTITGGPSAVADDVLRELRRIGVGG